MADAFACQAITTDFYARPAKFKGKVSSFGTNLANPYSATRHQAHYHRTLVALDNNPTSYTIQTRLALTEALRIAIVRSTLGAGDLEADSFPLFEVASLP